jgi:hypothetical protein
LALSQTVGLQFRVFLNNRKRVERITGKLRMGDCGNGGVGFEVGFGIQIEVLQRGS